MSQKAQGVSAWSRSASGNSRPSQPILPVGALPLRPETGLEAGPATRRTRRSFTSGTARDLFGSIGLMARARNQQPAWCAAAAHDVFRSRSPSHH
jgi:hypothetical protein